LLAISSVETNSLISFQSRSSFTRKWEIPNFCAALPIFGQIHDRTEHDDGFWGFPADLFRPIQILPIRKVDIQDDEAWTVGVELPEPLREVPGLFDLQGGEANPQGFAEDPR